MIAYWLLFRVSRIKSEHIVRLQTAAAVARIRAIEHDNCRHLFDIFLGKHNTGTGLWFPVKNRSLLVREYEQLTCKE
jgi:hypothetical protein